MTEKNAVVTKEGRVAEWFKAAVLKTARGCELSRGFESHPFRQHIVNKSKSADGNVEDGSNGIAPESIRQSIVSRKGGTAG